MSDPSYAAAAPVHDAGTGPEEGIGIALSGGGYRAMLFHAGTLWRLYELGLLERAARISSVSGGSIASAVLALAWPRLQWGDGGASFAREVVAPIRRLAGRTIDRPAILLGFLFRNSSWFVDRCYRKHLFGKATLQDLPDRPRFVFNATELHAGTLWRFAKPYVASWKLGRSDNPELLLATAVAASSGFPPFLSPVRLGFRPSPAYSRDESVSYPRRIRLTDGGVYDNLGLETVWKRYRTLFVSDGGATLDHVRRPSPLYVPQTLRALAIMQNQVGALRLRQLVGSLTTKEGTLARNGAYIGIAANPAGVHLASTVDCPPQRTSELAATPTRLRALADNHQERLINWGYAIADARIREFYDTTIAEPEGFPYRASGV